MESAFPPRPQLTLRARSFRLELGRRTQVMGILNCTPDSFSDGGRYLDAGQARERLAELREEGADWIDVGGESTRPGAAPVPWEEEWRRIEPAFAEVARGFPLPVSVDTTKSEVAERALACGASLVNDVSGLRFDPRLAALAAASGAGLILMHMQGEPRTMQENPHYEAITAEIAEFLGTAMVRATERGVEAEQLVVDPGIGFGKTARHNLTVLRELPAFSRLGRPVLIGASRKAFLGRELGLTVGERVEASVAVHVAAALAGAHIVRVHDVRATVRAVRIADSLLAGA